MQHPVLCLYKGRDGSFRAEHDLKLVVFFPE